MTFPYFNKNAIFIKINVHRKMRDSKTKGMSNIFPANFFFFHSIIKLKNFLKKIAISRICAIFLFHLKKILFGFLKKNLNTTF